MENRVRVLRKGRGETQEELAQTVGVTRQTVIAIESGRYAPSLTLAFVIAGHYGLPIEEIFSHAATCACHPHPPAVPAGELPAPAPPA